MVNMLESGVKNFVEVGPKKVLAGLLKKITPSGEDVKIHNIQNVQSLEDFLK
jgi:[acyl-carrier-protein] S-malonyltransferase